MINLTIQPNYIACFFESQIKGRKRSRLQLATNDNLKKNSSGFLSKGSRKRIKMLTNWFVHLNRKRKVKGAGYPWKVAFVTLTLSKPQGDITDQYLKRYLLNGFLKELKRKAGKAVQYIWRAEKQQNGNLHFHLIIDCFFDKDELRGIWNNLQRVHGFLEPGETAPSTEIKGIKSRKQLAVYISKYVSKEADNAKPVGGRLWQCSRPVSRLRGINCGTHLIDIDWSFYEKIKTGCFGPVKVIDREHAQIVMFDVFNFFHSKVKNFIKESFELMQSIFRDNIFNEQMGAPLISRYWPEAEAAPVPVVAPALPVDKQMNLF